MRPELGHSRGARPHCVEQKLWRWPERGLRTKAWSSRLCSRHLCIQQKSGAGFAFQECKQGSANTSKSHLLLPNHSCSLPKLPAAFRANWRISLYLSLLLRIILGATLFAFLPSSSDRHPLGAQDGDLSLKLAEALGIAQDLYPLTKPNLLCCLLKVLLSSWSAFFRSWGQVPSLPCAQLPGMPFLKEGIPYGRSAFMGRSISDAPVEQMLHVNHAGD